MVFASHGLHRSALRCEYDDGQPFCRASAWPWLYDASAFLCEWSYKSQAIEFLDSHLVASSGVHGVKEQALLSCKVVVTHRFDVPSDEAAVLFISRPMAEEHDGTHRWRFN